MDKYGSKQTGSKHGRPQISGAYTPASMGRDPQLATGTGGGSTKASASAGKSGSAVDGEDKRSNKVR